MFGKIRNDFGYAIVLLCFLAGAPLSAMHTVSLTPQQLEEQLGITNYRPVDKLQIALARQGLSAGYALYVINHYPIDKDFRLQQSEGRTVIEPSFLMYAIMRKPVPAIIKALLDRGNDPNFHLPLEQYYGVWVQHFLPASDNNNIDERNFYIQVGTPTSANLAYLLTERNQAEIQDRIQIQKILLNAGANPNEPIMIEVIEDFKLRKVDEFGDIIQTWDKSGIKTRVSMLELIASAPYFSEQDKIELITLLLKKGADKDLLTTINFDPQSDFVTDRPEYSQSLEERYPLIRAIANTLRLDR
jgi:hypothetical protein